MSGHACEHAIEYIYLFIDEEELTLSRRSRIRWHLRRCGGCTDAFAFEERLKVLIRERGRSQPPPELFATLRALIEEERAHPRPEE